ncbi:hypothetical protein FOL47_000975 [Perkinsus chesapeaki]|uniref:Uncharacterized protein n=1 Tax=Perkinsus chesapeaki TaxID=330153 RepID=A0A7J6KTJ4_PERCH|nr:hypothetical protein FOL47_000975 [Perkinsus chesapeaki]
MVDRSIIVRKTVVDPLLEGEQVDEGIKSLLVEQLVKEKILSQLLLSNLSDAAIQRMAGRIENDDKETFKLYMVTLVDQAKAAQAAKRQRVDTEQEKEDLQRFRQNITSRFGPDVEVPPTLVPPYRLLSKLSRSPFEHLPASEFLVSAASTDKSGVQRVEDLNTGKAVSVRTGKTRKISSLAQWVEAYCRWCTALFMVSDDKKELNPLAMFKYLLKILQLAEKRNVQAAVVFDHKYRSALPGYHQEGRSISEVLENDLDPSLYLMAQFGGLEDFDNVYEQDDQNRHGKKREERPICAYYQRGQNALLKRIFWRQRLIKVVV